MPAFRLEIDDKQASCEVGDLPMAEVICAIGRPRRPGTAAASSHFSEGEFLSVHFDGRKLRVIELALGDVGHLKVDVMGET